MPSVWVENPSKGPHGAFFHILASKISTILNGLDYTEGHVIASVAGILFYDAIRIR